MRVPPSPAFSINPSASSTPTAAYSDRVGSGQCVAIVANDHENWLLIEKIPGVELWQVGELSVWEAVATWLGRFHARFASEIRALRADNPHLLDHSKEWFRSWADRAGAALGNRTTLGRPSFGAD